MKRSRRLNPSLTRRVLLAVITIAGLVILGPRSAYFRTAPDRRSPAPARPPSTLPARAASSLESLPKPESAWPSPDATTPPETPDRLAATLALVHARLREAQQLETGDTSGQERLLAELTSLLTAGNTEPIVRSLSADELATPFGTAALDRWLALHPFQAATWISLRPDATEEHALAVARRFQRDTTGLSEFCDALPDSPWKQDLLAHAARETLVLNPVDALAFAERLAPGPRHDDVLQTVAYDWATRDATAATAWIARLDDPALRDSLFAVVTKAIAATDCDLAASWLTTAAQSASAHAETVLSLAETWVGRSPADAARWVAQLPSEAGRAAAEDLVFQHWLTTDAGSAMAWAVSLPDRDQLLARSAAAQTARDHPLPDPE